MGYRSEWKLALFGRKQEIQACIEWMKGESDSKDDDRSSTFDFILLDMQLRPDGDNLWFIRDEDYCKCNELWDEVIEEITSKATELGLNWAYARLGEDPEDVDERNDGQLWITINRSLGDVER